MFSHTKNRNTGFLNRFARSQKELALALCAGLAAAVVTGPALAIDFADTGMVNIKDYGATSRTSGSPTNDDSFAIRAAILDVTNPGSANYSKTIYIPSGIYDIGSEIVAEEEYRGDMGCGAHDGEGTVVMVGATTGSRPVLRLMNNTWPAGTGQRIMLEIKNQRLQGPESCAFRNGFRGIDIDLGTGNSDAIGLKFDAAQDSFLEDVKVIATGASRGIIAVPGRSMAATNIEVVGGDVGIELHQSSLGSVLVGVKLSGQTGTPLVIGQLFRGIAIVGLDISTTTTTAIKLLPDSPESGYTSHLSLYDARINFTGSAGTAIFNPDNRSISLINVFTKKAAMVVDNGEGNDVTTTGTAWKQLASYWRAPRFPGGAITGVYRYQSGATLPASDANDPAPAWGSTTSVPSNLITRHVPKTYAFSDSGAILARSLGETGDARSEIQNKIDNNANKTIFLPAGVHEISGPITLKAKTKLVGAPGMRTVLRPTWTDAAGGAFVIETLNDSNGDDETVIQDIVLDPPLGKNNNIGGMRWRAGPYSVVRRVRIGQSAAHRETNKIDYLIEGNGGGRWYSLADHMNIPNKDPDNPLPYEQQVPVDCNYRKLLVSGTTRALTFYGLNLERGGNKKKRAQHPFGELRNAKNARFFGQKMEIDGADVAAVEPSVCNNERPDQPLDKGIAWDINGTTENVYMAMTFSNDITTPAPLFRVTADVKRIAIAGLYVQPDNTPVVTETFPLFRDVRSDGTTEIDRTHWLGLFKREGTTTATKINHNAWDHLP